VKHILKLTFVCFFLFSCATASKEEPKAATPPAVTKTEHPSAEIDDPEELLKKGEEAYQQRQDADAYTYWNRLETVFPKHDHSTEIKNKLQELKIRLGIGRIRVGAFLPMTGEFARFGESALDGMACALGVFDPCVSEDENIQLIVGNSEGVALRAGAVLQPLVEEQKVAIIVGPLLSKVAEAAVPIAENKEIPMIVLAPQSELGRGKKWVFQHSITPESEVTALARWAKEKGMKNFLVLHPENSYGRKYLSIFQQKMGGSDVSVEVLSYPEGTLDFTNILRSLKLNQNHVRLYGKGNNPSYDGIFIPDSYRQVRLIAPALDLVKIRAQALLGTMRWNHPHLIAYRQEKKDKEKEKENKKPEPSPLEGAVFVGGFSTELLQNFQTAYGREGGWLEMFALQATQKALGAIRNRQNDYRPDVLSSLSRLYSWNDDHSSQFDMPLLTVKEGRIEPVTANGQ